MATSRRDCDGLIASLRGARVICTGKTYVDGAWKHRDALHAAIRERGAQIVSGTQNRAVTLLVLGGLPAVVTDPEEFFGQDAVVAFDLAVVLEGVGADALVA